MTHAYDYRNYLYINMFLKRVALLTSNGPINETEWLGNGCVCPRNTSLTTTDSPCCNSNLSGVSKNCGQNDHNFLKRCGHFCRLWKKDVVIFSNFKKKMWSFFWVWEKKMWSFWPHLFISQFGTYMSKDSWYVRSLL